MATLPSDLRASLWSEYVARRGLNRFITDTSPSFDAPTHCAPLVELLERCETEAVRAVVALPPGHFKTETILHGCARLLQRDPSFTIGYLSYASDFAATKCIRAKMIARRAGVVLSGRDREDYFETPAGGLMRSSGVRGQITGTRYRLVVVDDPVKNREEAESQTIRDKTGEAFESDILTREDLRGTSFLVVHTPWHTDDLGQRLVAKGWPFVRLPAIDDAGEALDPVHWPLAKLEAKRAEMTAYAWESLYQCRPVPRGGAVFNAPTYCMRDGIPKNGIRAGFGLDGAYSTKSHADYSVFLVLVRGPVERDVRPIYYVADLMRVQKSQPDFVAAVKPRAAEWPGIRGGWYTSTTERGNADLMSAMGLPVEAMPATADKFVRAQAVSAAWNGGRIRVPRDAPWAADFVSEVTRFTGLGDAHDDQVDALAAAFDRLDTADFGRYAQGVRRLRATW